MSFSTYSWTLQRSFYHCHFDGWTLHEQHWCSRRSRATELQCLSCEWECVGINVGNQWKMCICVGPSSFWLKLLTSWIRKQGHFSWIKYQAGVPVSLNMQASVQSRWEALFLTSLVYLPLSGVLNPHLVKRQPLAVPRVILTTAKVWRFQLLSVIMLLFSSSVKNDFYNGTGQWGNTTLRLSQSLNSCKPAAQQWTNVSQGYPKTKSYTLQTCRVSCIVISMDSAFRPMSDHLVFSAMMSLTWTWMS